MSLNGTDLVSEASKFIGDQYVYGAAGPNTFDCSGLVQYSLEQLGMSNVPRTSEDQYAWTNHIGETQIQPGSLIFEQYPGDNSPPGHVAIYAGMSTTGQQMIVEAPEPGQQVHEIPWSPTGQQVIGYGDVPGLDYTNEPYSTSADSALGNIEGSLGNNGVAQFISSGLQSVGVSSVPELLERGGLIVLGGILLILGVVKLTGVRTPKNAIQNKTK
jgi:hypothetical protein